MFISQINIFKESFPLLYFPETQSLVTAYNWLCYQHISLIFSSKCFKKCQKVLEFFLKIFVTEVTTF